MRYPPPGEMIDIGGCRLHLYQEGLGSTDRGPTVVLESGIAGSLLSWSLVQSRIAAFARVCSYDRAGLGWSDACAKPRTVEQMVKELAAVLDGANVTPPYILAGHSFGGLLMRAYAYLRPEQVAGLVLVDPVSLEAWAQCATRDQQRLALGVRLSRRGAWLARLGVVRLALWTLVSSGPLLPKLLAKATAPRGVNTLERLTAEVRKLPPEVWPIVRAHWSRPKSFEAMANYLECLPGAAASALPMSLPPHIPVTILSAANSSAAELRERDGWAAASRGGRHVRVNGSGHWIQLEQPDAVVQAIHAIFDEAVVAPRSSK